MATDRFSVNRQGSRNGAIFSRSKLPDLSSDQTGIFEWLAVTLKRQLDAISPYVELEIGLIGQREVDRESLPAEKLKIVLELLKEIAKDGGEFVEAFRKLMDILADCASTAADVAEGAAGQVTATVIAGALAPFIGVPLAVGIAVTSLIAAAQDRREKKHLLRVVDSIVARIDNNKKAIFLTAYDNIRGLPVSAGAALQQSQTDLSVQILGYLEDLGDAIGGAPAPHSGWGRRKPEFDDWIKKAFAPVSRYLLIAVIADYVTAQELGHELAFRAKQKTRLASISSAREELKKRMTQASIQNEQESGAATIYRLLDEYYYFCDTFAKASASLESAQPRTGMLVVLRRVQYLADLRSAQIWSKFVQISYRLDNWRRRRSNSNQI